MLHFMREHAGQLARIARLAQQARMHDDDAARHGKRVDRVILLDQPAVLVARTGRQLAADLLQRLLCHAVLADAALRAHLRQGQFTQLLFRRHGDPSRQRADGMAALPPQQGRGDDGRARQAGQPARHLPPVALALAPQALQLRLQRGWRFAQDDGDVLHPERFQRGLPSLCVEPVQEQFRPIDTAHADDQLRHIHVMAGRVDGQLPAEKMRADGCAGGAALGAGQQCLEWRHAAASAKRLSYSAAIRSDWLMMPARRSSSSRMGIW